MRAKIRNEKEDTMNLFEKLRNMALSIEMDRKTTVDSFE